MPAKQQRSSRVRSANGRAALRLTEIARGHEAQLGAGKRGELAPRELGRGDGDDVEGRPDALGEEDDGAAMLFVVVAVVVDVFVRLRGGGENGQREHQCRSSGREEAAKGVDERCVGEHAGVVTVKASIMPKASSGGNLREPIRGPFRGDARPARAARPARDQRLTGGAGVFCSRARTRFSSRSNWRRVAMLSTTRARTTTRRTYGSFFMGDFR